MPAVAASGGRTDMRRVAAFATETAREHPRPYIGTT